MVNFHRSGPAQLHDYQNVEMSILEQMGQFPTKFDTEYGQAVQLSLKPKETLHPERFEVRSCNFITDHFRNPNFGGSLSSIGVLSVIGG